MSFILYKNVPAKSLVENKLFFSNVEIFLIMSITKCTIKICFVSLYFHHACFYLAYIPSKLSIIEIERFIQQVHTLISLQLIYYYKVFIKTIFPHTTSTVHVLYFHSLHCRYTLMWQQILSLIKQSFSFFNFFILSQNIQLSIV